MSVEAIVRAPASGAEELRRRFAAEVEARDPGLLERFPVERYLGFFRALPAYTNYNLVPAEAAHLCDAIEGRAGAETLEAYHRLAMIDAMAALERQDEPITPELAELRGKYLSRVLSDMAAPRRGFHRHGNNQFAKDFAVCRGKLLPGGVELIDRRSGVPRRTLLSGGARQLVGGAAFLLGRAGGFRPFYELHFDRRSIGAFNEAGYTELYLRVAELLALDPAVRGVMSSSWWHDPQLAAISPELAFIDRHPKTSGARLFFVEENETATADATRFAERRKALHSEGSYRPRVYLLAWARRDILAWAESRRGRVAEGGALG